MKKRCLQKSEKINVRLKFLRIEDYYALIQPHFDYGCSLFPLLKKNFKLTLQKTQNRCIHFCLNLPPRSHIDPSHFRKINWLAISDRVEFCTANTFFKYHCGLYQDIFMKFLSPHSADKTQDHRWHWTNLCVKQIQWGKKKLILTQCQTYGPK